MTRRLSSIVALSALAALVACAPKPTRVNLVERACLEATMAESSAAADQKQVEVLLSEIGEKEARLVELQRLRSRIVTGKLSDEDLVQIELEPRREPEPAPLAQDTVQTAPADTVTTEGTPAAQEPSSAPSDTTGAVEPTGPTAEPGSSITPSQSEQPQQPTANEQPASEGKQATPSEGAAQQQTPRTQTEETAP